MGQFGAILAENDSNSRPAWKLSMQELTGNVSDIHSPEFFVPMSDWQASYLVQMKVPRFTVVESLARPTPTDGHLPLQVLRFITKLRARKTRASRTLQRVLRVHLAVRRLKVTPSPPPLVLPLRPPARALAPRRPPPPRRARHTLTSGAFASRRGGRRRGPRGRCRVWGAPATRAQPWPTRARCGWRSG
jgi:hypothetical protein